MSLRHMTSFLYAFLLAAMSVFAAGCTSSEEPSRVRDTPAARVDAPAAASARAERRAEASARPRIVFLGDSLTAGYGLPREHSVPSLIQARLDAEGYRYEVVNAGVS